MKDEVSKILKDKEGIALIHNYFSASCFNETWTFIEKEGLSEEELENMLLAANASLYHWKKRPDCKPENLSIAYWQLSRVYYLANNNEEAISFGEKCLKVSQDGSLDAFYIGYAHEALANGYLGSGQTNKAKAQVELAKGLLEKITDKENQKYLRNDLEKIEKEF